MNRNWMAGLNHARLQREAKGDNYVYVLRIQPAEHPIYDREEIDTISAVGTVREHSSSREAAEMSSQFVTRILNGKFS